jgi:hypothetical protein
MSAEPLPSLPASGEKPHPVRPKYLTRPRSEKKEDLGFERRPMVDWLSPGQLARTGLKAAISAVFGAYADKREVMAALNQDPDLHDYSDRQEIWIDYVADLGDGFDATYSIASLLAAADFEPFGRETLRGNVVVLGGDQVYPTASYDEYWNRMMMPYRAALPCVLEGEVPHLYAVPGNHDWYDGLSNFTRIFCQQNWIGGWKTQQSRSYFALKLPHNWWLWAIDIQLEGFIDDAQLKYFGKMAEKVGPDDQIILCTAEPSWTFTKLKGPEAFRSLSFFEDRTIREKAGSEPRVVLTGDLHHYTRYESQDGKTQRITAGGGGAYLFATHQMPDALTLNEGKVQVEDQLQDRKVEYRLKSTFPSQGRSRLQSFGALALPFRSWRFGIFLAAPLYTLYAWTLQSASRLRTTKPSFIEEIRGMTNFGDVVSSFGNVLAQSPVSLHFTLLILLGTIAFCDTKRTLVKWGAGLLHGLSHIGLALLLIWAFASWNSRHIPAGVHPAWHLLAFIAEMLVAGCLLGGALMAVYLLLCSFLGRFHTNEVFSSQRLQGFKNFLRLHIDPQGQLTLYPVGVRKTCTDWELQPGGRLCDPWWMPKRKIEPELIEPPISIPRTSAGADATPERNATLTEQHTTRLS